MIEILSVFWLLTVILSLVWGVTALITLEKRFLMYMWIFNVLMWGASTIIKLLSIN